MGYSTYEFFNDLMRKYNELHATERAAILKAQKKKKSKVETTESEEDGGHDLDLFKRAFTEMAEYRRKSFIGSLVTAEAEASGESEDEVVSDILTEYSEDQMAIIRFRMYSTGEVNGFSIDRALPKGVSLLIKGNG